MDVLKVPGRRIRDLSLTALHWAANVTRGRQRHVLFTGTDPSTLPEFVRLLRDAVPAAVVPQNSQNAAATKNRFSPVIVTWSATDLASMSEVTSAVGSYRSITVVCFVADPRATVTKVLPSKGSHRVSNADYSLNPDGSGLTLPGVVPQFEALNEIRQNPDLELLEIKPGLTQFEEDEIAVCLQRLLGASEHKGLKSWVRRVQQNLAADSNWSGNTARIDHVKKQIRLHPDLESAAKATGFPPSGFSSKLPPKKGKDTAGKIIGFFTPDEIYRKEAERLSKSLDRLGLDYELFEVKAEEDWVRTTLLKPQWMLKARTQLEGSLLYIDVDAFVHENPWPYLSQYTSDLAAVYDYGVLNSATIFINDTAGSREVLASWESRAQKRLIEQAGKLEQTGEDSDQTVLRDLVDEAAQVDNPSFSFQRLPMNMAYIFDGKHRHELVGPIYIEQLQASRESTKHEKRLARRRQRLQELDPAGS